MSARTKWAAGFVGLAAVIASGAVLIPWAEAWLRDRLEVGREIKLLDAANLTPEESAGVGERLRAAADRPWLSPAERAFRLDRAGWAFLRAGRPADAKPLFRAGYELVKDSAEPDEVVESLRKINLCLTDPRTAAEADELRQNHAAIRALGPRVGPGGVGGLTVRSSPADLAKGIEWYVRHRSGTRRLPPAEERALLDEAVGRLDEAVGPWDRSTDADGLFALASVLELRGDNEKAAAVFGRVAGGGGVLGQIAFVRLVDLRYPDATDPRRTAALERRRSEQNDDNYSINQHLGQSYLAQAKYPEAAAVFRRMADREPNRNLVPMHLSWLASTLEKGGQKAEAEAVRQRLRAEFPHMVSGGAAR